MTSTAVHSRSTTSRGRDSTLALAALVLLVLLPAARLSAAATASLPEIEEPVTALTSTIDNIEKAVERSFDNEEDLARLRLEIEGLGSGATLLREHFGPRLAGVKSQIETLGPPPGKDDPPESAQVAAERERLASLSAAISGAIRTTDLVEERSRQLADKVQNRRQEIFAGRILTRSPPPISPRSWRAFAYEAPGAGRQLSLLAASWLKAARGQSGGLAVLIVSALALYFGLRVLARRILARRLDAPMDTPPSFFARAAAAIWVAPLVALAPAATLALLAWGLDSLGLLVHEIGKAAPVIWTGVALLLAVRALSTAILQPDRPDWRLAALADAPARTAHRLLVPMVAFYAADLVLGELAKHLFMPLPVSVTIAAVTSAAVALLLIWLVRTPFTPPAAASLSTQVADAAAQPEPDAAPAPPSIMTPRVIKVPLLAIALLILAAVLAGYVALGRFVVGQLIATGSAAVVVGLMHQAIRALLGAPGSGIRPLHEILSERAGLSEDQGTAVTRALSLILDAGLALVAIPIILLTWGYTLPEAWSWLKAAIFGFEIGQFRISFARILLAILLFLALLFLTRLAQRWLQAAVLHSAKIDRGIANSIHTAVGYTGFVLAALVAVSYGGLDITSFAIVAGALSVGIGFGLQSIINNFVSGLILLVERPIKVGDLVAVGGREGRVRSIAVRSTEIETGDKASLIVPNSELITGTVTNWTHRNALGRVLIKVGASYNADPEQICDVLAKVAAECPLIMQHPPAGVSFDNFGPNGFEFSLSGVVADVGKAGAAQTDLRLRIVKAFRTAGIEMPHPQHDIHLHDLGRVWSLLSRAAAERAAEGLKPADAPAPDPAQPDAAATAEPAQKSRKRKDKDAPV